MNYKTVTHNFNDFLINIQNLFQKESNKTLFQQRNTLKIVNYEQKEYVVKSFKIPHLFNQLVYKFFRDSKAQRSYLNSIKLKKLNINTPNPIGYVEFPSLFLFKESYYISSLIDYDFEIRAVFANEDFKDRENILEKFIEFSYQLHTKGIYHIDYSPGNILIKKVEGQYRFYIIDVNRMKFLKFNNRLRMKNLSKLTKSSKDNTLMLKYYAKISGLKEEVLLKELTIALKEEEKYLQNKQKLKKLISSISFYKIKFLRNSKSVSK